MAKLSLLLDKIEINLNQLNLLMQAFKTSNPDSQYLFEVIESLIRAHKRLGEQKFLTLNIKLIARDIEFSLRQCDLLHTYLSDRNQHFFSNMRSRDQAITWLTALEKKYNKIFQILKVDKPNSLQPQKSTAWVTQGVLSDEDLYPLFQQTLYNVRKESLKAECLPPKVFISYAWPLPEHTNEYWVKEYIIQLAENLKSAGVIVYLDEMDSRYGYSLQDHINRLKESDAVLLIGTPSLKTKYETPVNLHMINDEFTEIIHQSKRLKIIPLLLEGRYELSFPRAITRNRSIEDWTNGDYINHFMSLLQHLTGLPNHLYEPLWRSVLKAYIRNMEGCLALQTQPTVTDDSSTSKQSDNLNRWGLFNIFASTSITEDQAPYLNYTG